MDWWSAVLLSSSSLTQLTLAPEIQVEIEQVILLTTMEVILMTKFNSDNIMIQGSATTCGLSLLLPCCHIFSPDLIFVKNGCREN